LKDVFFSKFIKSGFHKQFLLFGLTYRIEFSLNSYLKLEYFVFFG
jgi:hypothetical protein